MKRFLILVDPDEGQSIEDVDDYIDHAFRDNRSFGEGAWIVVSGKELGVLSRRMEIFAGDEGSVLLVELTGARRGGFLDPDIALWMSRWENA